ncbi:TPA: restriction endonuclease subunit S [Enterococcus faecalis]|nr:restriction endonuclease subunit S [Enterococcus sp.]HAP5223024.1 restriction endonuclease subunit S [Enterococcus faecalis]
MRDEMKKVPRLRFRGFQEDWELCKLSTEFEKVNERNDGSLGREHWISVAKMYFQNPDKVQSNNIDTRTYVMRTGDIAFEGHPNKEFKFGRFVANDIGTGVVSELFPIYRHKQEYDNYYWKNAIQIERVMGPIFAKSITSSGNSSNKLDPNHFLRQQVFIPKLEEQKKIGLFLKKLDDTITLHQRKLDQLKELKKAYLQVMFPVKDERAPKLRFADFEGEWEQCKLEDYATYRRGSFPQPYGNKKWYDGENAMPFVQVIDVTEQLSLVKDTKQKISKLAQSKSVFVSAGKVVVTLQGSIGRVAITQYNSYIDRTLLVFESYEKETDEYFWAYTIQQKFEIEKRKAPGGTIKTITKEALSSFEVNFPEYEEQQKNGNFLKNLDNILTLDQKKLDQLKSLKKSYLQNMFI